MKPPPRTRSKPNRSLRIEPAPRSKQGSKWQQTEQKKLLTALKKLSCSGGSQKEMDYVYLKTCVPTRSLAQIRWMVESLKDKVILCARRRKRLEERNVRKPIEEWTHVASAVTGNLEENISSAFSQMLIVSSTEPCTLKNFDPPHIYRSRTEPIPVGHTGPPCLPVQGQHPDINTAHSVLMFKSQAPVISPGRTFAAPHQVVTLGNSKICPLQQWLSPTAGTLPATTSSAQSPVISCHVASSPLSASARVSPAVGPSLISVEAGSTESIGSSVNISRPSVSVSQVLQMPLFPSGTSPNNTKLPAAGQPCSAISSPLATSFITPTAAANSMFRQTNKYTRKDSPMMIGVECVVDLEKIYRLLSKIQISSDVRHLTPMESAILLDLLMSLPEELFLLNCNKLHKHMVQMYQCLSSPADSSIANELFTERRATSTQRVQNLNGTNSHCNTSDVIECGGGKVQQLEPESQTVEVSLCPPLNPFMVPLNLLVRRRMES